MSRRTTAGRTNSRLPPAETLTPSHQQYAHYPVPRQSSPVNTLHQQQQPASTSTSTSSFVAPGGRRKRTSLIPTTGTNSATNVAGYAAAGDLSTSSATSFAPHNLSHEHLEGLRRQRHLSTLSLSPRRQQHPTTGTGSGSSPRQGSRRAKDDSTCNEVRYEPTTNSKPATSNTTRRRTGSILANGSYLSMNEPDQSELGDLPEAAVRYDQDQDQQQEDGETSTSWTMVDRMRNWRNDAMTQHLYSTAEFWGGKILAITANPDDAFWLAQTHFYIHQYAQAETILTSIRPATGFRLTDTSLACRYLAAQCQVRLGKWDDALEMVGRDGFGFEAGEDNSILEDNLGQEQGDQGGGHAGESGGDGGIKLTASTSHLRGLIYLHLGASDLAKEAFMEALTRDVKCFESFQVLIGSEMMTSAEEWEFVQGLPYLAQTQDDAQFVRMMYTVRLKKITHHQEVEVARRTLTEDYGLGDDPDVMFGLADELYTSSRFAECYKLTSRILSIHTSHRPTLPIHLACMHHLPHLRSKLYLLSHELVENEPDDCISWFAVGLWYFAGKRWEESRRYFGKSVLLDSRFGPAWLAFAHSYAFEGEHDQAITAYSTALRHSQGSHLPLLFIGMQHLGLMNVTLANEYLTAAKNLCQDDPLANNELGVVCFHRGEYAQAITHFEKALDQASRIQASPSSWAATHLNMGHAYRKVGRLNEAHTSFRRVISLDSRSSAAYSALGMIEHQLGQYQESISRYHEALSITPGDPITCGLLKIVLDEAAVSISRGHVGFPGLSASVLGGIDEMVEELERDVLLGRSPKIEPVVGVLEAISGIDRSSLEPTSEMGEDEEEEETMDMS